MGEIDRVRPTLSFSQLRNASQYQVGDRRKRQQGEHEGQPEEPHDTIELSEETAPMAEQEHAPGEESGDGHIDLAA